MAKLRHPTIDETRKKLLNCVESADADGVELALGLDVYFGTEGDGKPCFACLLGTTLADQDIETLAPTNTAYSFIRRAATGLGIDWFEASALEDGFENGVEDRVPDNSLFQWEKLGAEFRQMAKFARWGR